MNIDEKSQELIERYLCNELDAEGRREFKLRLRNDPDFAELVQSVQGDMETVLKRHGGSDLVEKLKIPLPKRIFNILDWVNGIVPVFFIFLAVVFLYNFFSPSFQAMMQDWFIGPSTEVLKYQIPPSEKESLAGVLQCWEEGNRNTAGALLQEELSNNCHYEGWTFYLLGLSSLNGSPENPAKALVWFGRADAFNGPFKRDINYYSGLAHLLNGDYKSAKTHFKRHNPFLGFSSGAPWFWKLGRWVTRKLQVFYRN